MRLLVKLLTISILVNICLPVSAQEPVGKINGTIQDGDQKLLQSATIALLKAKDSSLVKMAVTDAAGKFEFEKIGIGSYLVRVSSVGFEVLHSRVFGLGSGTGPVELGVLALKPRTKDLEAVVVRASRPLVEQKIDRTIVNVEASVTSVGNSALEVLEKAPGVTVDKDGNISLKGKEGVMILVDGRPTYLGGADLVNLLRSMQAGQLDQIEIMTNPPAKYDAAGNAGIINIKTKKNKQFGYNGSASIGYGQWNYPKFNESFNFNYRKNKLNWFTNLGHNYNRSYGLLTIQRNFRDSDTKNLLSHFDQKNYRINESNSYNAKLGVDFFADKKTTLGLVLNGYLNDRTNVNNNQSKINEFNGNSFSQTNAVTGSDATWKNFSTNLYFRRVLDTTGQELSADLDYILYDSRDDQSLINAYFDGAGNPTDGSDTLLGALPQNIKIYSGRIDYLKPLKKDGRFELGVKSSYVKTDNNAAYDSLLNGQMVNDANRSNYFIYEENINAAYANISGSLGKKWNGQLGLRLENTNAKGRQVTTGERFNRHYTQLFPTAYLQYLANDKNSIVLNYGRRIRRPDYQSLNPFIHFLDKYTYEQGNPNLKPQFSHNIELSHTYRNFLTTTINYSRTNDIIQDVLEQIEEKNETYMKKQNIAKQRQYGISVSINNPVTKWWTNSFYVNVYNNKFDGIISDTFVSISATTLSLNGSQQFKFGKTWTAEFSGFFRSGGVEGVIRAHSMGMLSAGIGKQVLKGKGSLRLNVRDIFYTQQFRAESRYSNVDAAFQQQRESRVVNVSFSYRFSKGKQNGSQRRRTNSASEEQNRVGGGN